MRAGGFDQCFCCHKHVTHCTSNQRTKMTHGDTAPWLLFRACSFRFFTELESNSPCFWDENNNIAIPLLWLLFSFCYCAEETCTSWLWLKEGKKWENQSEYRSNSREKDQQGMEKSGFHCLKEWMSQLLLSIGDSFHDSLFWYTQAPKSNEWCTWKLLADRRHALSHPSVGCLIAPAIQSGEIQSDERRK
jgi:hypothetical protein